MTTQAMSWHMLAMMGIDVWIAKNQPTAAFDAHSFSRWQDSLQAERDEYCEQSLENQQKHQQLKHQDLKHPITEAKKLSEPMSDAAILTTPSADVILSDVDVPNHAKFDKLGVMNESVGTDIYLPKYLVDVRLFYQMRDFLGNDRSFARTCPCQHKQRSVSMFECFLLSWIECGHICLIN